MTVPVATAAVGDLDEALYTAVAKGADRVVKITGEVLGGFVRYAPVMSIDQYAQILFDCGAEDILCFEKVYAHILADSDAVVEWISGTVCVPYFERLGGHKDEFMKVIRAKMQKALPQSPVFYPFRRTFFTARKPA